MALSIASLTGLSDSSALAARIEQTYFDSATGIYREEVGKKDPAFNWTMGIVLSAQNAMARLDSANVPKLVATLGKAEAYWNPTGPVAGFDVLPGPPHSNDRYYDDNAWMVMSLAESYEITGDDRWLKRAEDALKFVLSGESAELGGGIFWREKEKRSKNTCSNGPAAAACLAVYHETKDEALLAKAEEIYRWTKKNLRDPADGLYFDNVNLEGKVERTKWSYNSALMLRSAKVLYAETQKDQYRHDAETLEKACVAHWIKPDGSIEDELQFAHLLFENLDPKSFDSQKCIDKLKSLASSDGFYPKRWTESKAKPASKLMIQASVLRALAEFELRGPH